MSPEIQNVLYWAMAGLVVCGYVTLWRMDANARSAERIHQAARRNVAENKRTMKKLKQSQANWEQLNEHRHELNNRYSETIDKMRDHHGIKDRFTIERLVEFEGMREHVFWTVRDHESGYLRDFRIEEEAKAHLAELKTKAGIHED